MNTHFKEESKTPKLKREDRIALHRRMAESYHNAYARKSVKDGATYDEWKFADKAVYWSPYFGNELIQLSKHPLSVASSATMEAKAYSLRFPDWGPAEFKCWPADNGFAMKTLFEGHTQDGTKMSFYSYGFVETNDQGEIMRWETHVSEEYNAFLDVAIGVHGPFLNGNQPLRRRRLSKVVSLRLSAFDKINGSVEILGKCLRTNT